MKTAIKLVLIYFLMQIVGALFAGPFCLLYTYFAYGTFDMDKAGQIAVAPTMLLGFVFMGLYLWRKNYLTGDKHLYSGVSPLSGMEPACRNDFHMYNRSSDVRTYFFAQFVGPDI
jgi:hypothetical protein